MLNRRILRMKAFKAIYCYAENPGMSPGEIQSFMEESCEACRDLYLFLLALIEALVNEAKGRIEAAKAKFNPTEEELNPKMKFVENSLTPLIAEDPDFRRIIQKKKFSWDQYDVFLRSLYERIRERKYFKDYLNSPNSSLQEDAKLWAKIFEKEFEDDAQLEQILEDMSIHWNDDLFYAAFCCKQTMLSLGEGKRWSLPPLYRSDMFKDKESDKLYITKVLRRAYAEFHSYVDRIAYITPKWNRDRICATDLALIVCGVAESECHEETSVRIIINEYVEIAKAYSTPESSSFVNGLLDKLINKHE